LKVCLGGDSNQLGNQFGKQLAIDAFERELIVDRTLDQMYGTTLVIYSCMRNNFLLAGGEGAQRLILVSLKPPETSINAAVPCVIPHRDQETCCNV
jgi:hypothetical protein